MRIMEKLTKTFGLMKDEDDKAKVKVIADEEFGTIKIVTAGGTAMLYVDEAESTASMLLVAEEWMRVQRGEV